VVNNTTITEAQIIAEMVRTGTVASETDIVAVMNLYKQTVVYFVSLGYRVDTALAIFNCSIKGNFESLKDIFTESRHSLQTRISPGSLLTDIFKGVIPTKVERKSNAPSPTTLIDHRSKSTNERITPGGAAQIEGKRLRFDVNDPSQGIFFIDSATEAAIRVELVMSNKPSLLWFETPQMLATGSYYLEVRTKPNGHVVDGRLPELVTAGSA
jgi:hypothetical protein